MNFNEIPSSDFLLGMKPVVVATLSQDTLAIKDGFGFGNKEKAREKKINKLWKKFDQDFVQGEKFKDTGYNPIILPIALEIDESSSNILKQRLVVVLSDSEIQELSALPDKDTAHMVFGLRLLTQEGEIKDIDVVPDLEVEQVDGQLQDTVQRYVYLKQELAERHREEFEHNIDLAKKKEMRKQAEVVDSVPQKSKLPTKSKDELKEKEPDKPDVEQRKPSQSVKPIESEVEALQSGDLTAEQAVEMDLKNYLDLHYKKPTVRLDLGELKDKYKGTDFAPIFDMMEVGVGHTDNEYNSQLTELQNRYIEDVRSLLSPEIKRHLTALNNATSVDFEESEYYKALVALNDEVDVEKQRVLEEIDIFRKDKENDYGYKRKKFLDELMLVEGEKYDTIHRPVMESEVEKKEELLKNAVNMAYREGIEIIETQADEAFQQGVDNLFKEIVARHERSLSEIERKYRKELDQILARYKAKKSSITAESESQLKNFMNLRLDYNKRSQAEVEALVKAQTPELERLRSELALAEKTKEDFQLQLEQSKVFADQLMSQQGDLQEKLKKSSAERNRLVEELSKITKEQEENKSTGRTAKIIGGFILGSVAVATIGLVGLKVYTDSSKVTELEQQILKLEEKANAKYRVGEYVPVSTPDGKVVYGRIEKVEENKVYGTYTDENGKNVAFEFANE